MFKPPFLMILICVAYKFGCIQTKLTEDVCDNTHWDVYFPCVDDVDGSNVCFTFNVKDAITVCGKCFKNTMPRNFSVSPGCDGTSYDCLVNAQIENHTNRSTNATILCDGLDHKCDCTIRVRSWSPDDPHHL